MWWQGVDLAAAYSSLKGSCKDSGAKLLSEVADEQEQSVAAWEVDLGHQDFFSRRVVEHWNPHPGGSSVLS